MNSNRQTASFAKPGIGKTGLRKPHLGKTDRHSGQNARRRLPIWGVIAGNGVMATSFWLLGAGGMLAKLVLLLFWVLMVAGSLRTIRLGPGLLTGLLILAGLIGLIMFGNGAGGAGDEKIRLIGNLMMVPVGLVAGAVIGRDCLRILMPAMLFYLILSSSFYLTHEGARLNHAFLFLGFFALCSVCKFGHRRWLMMATAGAVFLSQTRIAVIAMLINAIGLIRFSRAMTWIAGLILVGIVAGGVMAYLPRLVMTHDSGRLAFWKMFAEIWRDGSDGQRWLGFGAGSVEEILSQTASFGSFGALHNDHFRILFETGIVGALLWGTGWAVVISMVRQTRLAVCILLSVFVTMITDNSLNYGHYLICCAIAAGISAQEGKNGEPVRND